MGTQIKTVGFGGTNSPVLKKSIGILSDGTAVALICDMNQTGVNGDGGDNTGVPKFYLYHSTDWSNWTLKATVATPGTQVQNLVASMVVDSANNIRIAYRWTGSSLRYRQINYSGSYNWSPTASDEVVASGPPSGYTNFSLIDIDTMGDGGATVVTGYYYNQTAGQKKTGVVSYIRTTGGSWVTHPVDVMINGASHLGYTDDLTLCGDNKTPIGGDNVGIFVYNCVRRGDNNSDFGDILRLVRVNVSTGARIAVHTIRNGHFSGVGGGFRKFWLFNRTSNEFSLVGVVNSSPMQCGMLKFNWNRSTNTAAILVDATTGPGQGLNINRGTNNHNWCAAGWNGDEKFLFFGIEGGGSAICTVGEFRTESNSAGNLIRSANFRPGWQYWDNGTGNQSGYYSPNGLRLPPDIAPVERIYGGQGRNSAGHRIAAMMFHHRTSGSPQSYSMQWRGLLLPFSPANVTPANGSTQSSDRPILTADYRLQMYWAQIPVRTIWYISSDPGFLTNPHQVGEPEANFVLPNGTSPGYLKKVMASYQIPGEHELNQGTWYVRALTFDYMGNAGAWSNANSFVITHPPVPGNLFPTAGAVFLYGANGSVTFNWKFTDPSPYDYQTAYQIIVESADSGAVLVDTGKVVSAAQTATLNIPLSGKDINLRWKIRLWDSDDVAGEESGYQLFYATDPPMPTITSPVGTPLNANPYFESGIDNWTAQTGSGATIAHLTTDAYEGTGSLQLTPDGVGEVPEVRSENVTGIVPGKSYTVPVHLKCAVSRAANVNIVWRDGAGTFLSSAGAVSVFMQANTWTPVKVSAIAPDGATQAQISISMGNTPPPSDVLTIDAAILRETAPAITTGVPTIQWTAGLGGNKVQASYRVRVTQGDALIYSSEWVNSSDTSHNIPVGYLANNQSYSIVVEVRDNLGLLGQDSIAVMTDWIEPPPPDEGWEVFVHDYARRGYIYITWQNNFFMDPDFSAWIVYRRRIGDAEWVRIGTYTAGPERYAHRDYGVASGQTYEYTITQVVDRFGDLVESVPNKVVTVTPRSDNYWLVDLIQPEKSIPIYNVTSDNFKEEYEQEAYSVIGRGRHVDYGERLGYAGSLNAQIRDKFLTGMARTNYALNPSFALRSVTGQAPDKWSVVRSGTISGSVTTEYVESANPSPSGRTPFRITARQMGATPSDSIGVSQDIVGLDFPVDRMTPGTQVTLSIWLGEQIFASQANLRIAIDWLDEAGSVTSTSSTLWDVSTLVEPLERYIPASSPDAARGNATGLWKRYAHVTTVPSPAPAGARIRFLFEGDNSFAGDARMHITGVQFEVGSMSDYIDGDNIGVEWTGVPQLSASATTGYYSARQQRLALEDIKSRKGSVYLRNPFGDIWLVAPGDIGVNRIPGVGLSEFVDVEIPYQEVSF